MDSEHDIARANEPSRLLLWMTDVVSRVRYAKPDYDEQAALFAGGSCPAHRHARWYTRCVVRVVDAATILPWSLLAAALCSVLAALKLAGVVTLPWWGVLSPIWVSWTVLSLIVLWVLRR
jgi:hypothetical protein